MSPRRVYVAYTPYHLLLALALQDRDGCPDGVVLFADEAEILSYAPEIEGAIGKLVDLQSAPTLELHPAREYPVRCRLAARSAQKFVRSVHPNEVYISHGLRPESQRLFRTLKGATSFNFVEDGFDSYIGVNRIDVPMWHQALHRLLCGSPRARSHDMVTAFAYDSYNVIAPELARVPQRLVQDIPVDSLRRAAGVLQDGIAVPTPERPITDLYLLGNSERMPDPEEYLRAMRSGVEARLAEDADTYIAVKAHPREKSRRLMSGVQELGDYMIPHWVPAELLVGLLHPEVTVHSGLTTFIVSGRKLLPERRQHLDQTVRPEHAEILRRWDPTLTYSGTDASEQAADETISKET